MWVLIGLFAAATLLLGWVMFGYFIYVWFTSLLRRRTEVRPPAEWPKMSIIIPCFNEAEAIQAKLQNTRELTYPADRMEVYFVDGGSTDGTTDILMRFLHPDEPFRVIHAGGRGKIQQINEVLPWMEGDYIVLTDTDALLDSQALQALAAEFASDEKVGVVGAYCRPHENANWIDLYFWDANNKSRFMESDWCTSSIVVAPCYAFRRGLIERFPEDVVADDIYAAFQSHRAGYRTVYSRLAQAVEMRSPETLTELLPHKFRKANAFLRESLRFLYLLPEMSSAVKVLYLTRISQQLLMPWLLLTWMLLALTLLTAEPAGRFDIIGSAIALLLTALLLAARAFRCVDLPETPRNYSTQTVIRGYILTNFILLATGLSYPFYRQNSCYSRGGMKVNRKETPVRTLLEKAQAQAFSPGKTADVKEYAEDFTL